jgi:hypothetical protein
VLALTGVVLGHTLAYGVAWPDGPQRSSLLQATGHAYWQAAVAAALLGGAAATSSHVVHALRRVEQMSLPRAGAWLALLQVAMFTMMETSERVAIDQPLTTLFDHHVFALGLLAQVVVAAVLVQIMRLLGRAALAVAHRIRTPRVASAALAPVFPSPTVAFASRIGSPCGSRAPPLAA